MIILNREQNLIKSKAHRKLNKWMIVSIISVFICYACDVIIANALDIFPFNLSQNAIS